MEMREDIQRAVGTFPNRAQALQALERLRASGFAMERVSVLTRQHSEGEKLADAEVKDALGTRAAEGGAAGAGAGGLAGGLAGLLVGVGALTIPGIGPVVTAGTVGAALAAALGGGAVGAAAGGLVGALAGWGVPKDRAEAFLPVIEQGGYLVIVDGDREQIKRADLVLHSGGIENYDVYAAPGDAQSRP